MTRLPNMARSASDRGVRRYRGTAGTVPYGPGWFARVVRVVCLARPVRAWLACQSDLGRGESVGTEP
jgi:hypothetical protein